MKLYYENELSEYCFEESYFQQLMKEKSLKEIEVYEAIPEKIEGLFYCKEFQEFGETGEGCGKTCDKYTPRNGKSGCCKYFSNKSYTIGRKKSLTPQQVNNRTI